MATVSRMIATPKLGIRLVEERQGGPEEILETVPERRHQTTSISAGGGAEPGRTRLRTRDDSGPPGEWPARFPRTAPHSLIASKANREQVGR